MAHAKFGENRKWAAGYDAEIEDIIRQMAGKIVSVDLADEVDDKSLATDYTISVGCGGIGGRVRRPGFWEKYHDVTFRYKVLSGVDTEYDKIMRGSPQWYLYGWASSAGGLHAWLFLDMDVVRYSKILESPKNIVFNRDGHSSFVAIGVDTLQQIGAIVGCNDAVAEYLGVGCVENESGR